MGGTVSWSTISSSTPSRYERSDRTLEIRTEQFFATRSKGGIATSNKDPLSFSAPNPAAQLPPIFPPIRGTSAAMETILLCRLCRLCPSRLCPSHRSPWLPHQKKTNALGKHSVSGAVPGTDNPGTKRAWVSQTSLPGCPVGPHEPRIRMSGSIQISIIVTNEQILG